MHHLLQLSRRRWLLFLARATLPSILKGEGRLFVFSHSVFLFLSSISLFFLVSVSLSPSFSSPFPSSYSGDLALFMGVGGVDDRGLVQFLVLRRKKKKEQKKSCKKENRIFFPLFLLSHEKWQTQREQRRRWRHRIHDKHQDGWSGDWVRPATEKGERGRVRNRE